MTEQTHTQVDPPAAHLGLELWAQEQGEFRARLAAVLGAELPAIGRTAETANGWRLMGVEPSVWWLIGPLHNRFERFTAISDSVQNDGSATDMTGAFARLRVSGPRWRSLLMIGGVFDAESDAFAPGHNAGTLLHHISVRYDVLSEDAVAVYVAPSYAEDLLHHLRVAGCRVNFMVS